MAKAWNTICKHCGERLAWHRLAMSAQQCTDGSGRRFEPEQAVAKKRQATQPAQHAGGAR